MAEVVSLKTGHPLVGTWKDANDESGTSVRFTIRAAGQSFDVVGVDASDEVLQISNVKWDGRALRFDSLVPSNGHRVEYSFEVVSPSEIRVRYTTSERWVRTDATA